MARSRCTSCGHGKTRWYLCFCEGFLRGLLRLREGGPRGFGNVATSKLCEEGPESRRPFQHITSYHTALLEAGGKKIPPETGAAC